MLFYSFFKTLVGKQNHGGVKKRPGNPRDVSLRRSVLEHQIGIRFGFRRGEISTHEISARLLRPRKRGEVRATTGGKRGRGYFTRRDEEGSKVGGVKFKREREMNVE